jgi:hypothetical protein
MPHTREQAKAYRKTPEFLEKQRIWRASKPPGYAAAIQAKSRLKNPGRAKTYYEANKERLKPIRQAWVAKNKEKQAALVKAWSAQNKDKRHAQAVAFRERNRFRVALYAGKRRRITRQATPTDAENVEIMELIFAEAAHRGLTVDHVVPLQAKLVCGLHAYYNTQLLTLAQNSAKGNRFEPVTTIHAWDQDARDPAAGKPHVS